MVNEPFVKGVLYASHRWIWISNTLVNIIECNITCHLKGAKSRIFIMTFSAIDTVGWYQWFTYYFLGFKVYIHFISSDKVQLTWHCSHVAKIREIIWPKVCGCHCRLTSVYSLGLFCLGLLVSVKGNLSTTANNDILDNIASKFMAIVCSFPVSS